MTDRPALNEIIGEETAALTATSPTLLRRVEIAILDSGLIDSRELHLVARRLAHCIVTAIEQDRRSNLGHE